jgi:hypothetical protein
VALVNCFIEIQARKPTSQNRDVGNPQTA